MQGMRRWVSCGTGHLVTGLLHSSCYGGNLVHEICTDGYQTLLPFARNSDSITLLASWGRCEPVVYLRKNGACQTEL